jgi:hypothetical protein
LVLGIELESGGFERDCGTRVFVAVFAVLRWVCSRVTVASFAVPAVERLSEFLKDSLCSKIEDFWNHERQSLSNELD